MANITEILRDFRPNFLASKLKKMILPSCKTLLDVGCGENSVVQFFSNEMEDTVGIEIFKEAIEKSKNKKIHFRYVQTGALDIDKIFESKSFDCVMAIDLIEHLNKNDASNLIKKMEGLTKKITILQTTNGFLRQDPIDGNDYQIHKCGFSTKELQDLGYEVMGMDGPKFLRGECAKIKYKPIVVFSIIATILDSVYRYFPKKSFNLLAYKRVKNI